jgi:hypothetical protein
LAGRPNATTPTPNGVIPEPQDSVDSILARMADGGDFSPAEVIALLSSHAVARSDHVILQQTPFDTTPFTFDTQTVVEVPFKGTGFSGNDTSNLCMIHFFTHVSLPRCVLFQARRCPPSHWDKVQTLASSVCSQTSTSLVVSASHLLRDPDKPVLQTPGPHARGKASS